MKKTILLGAIALISLSAFAQDKDDSGIKFGVKAGVTFPTFSLSGDDTKDLSAKSITSFYVGGIVNIPVHSMLSVQPGLTLVGKGSKISSKVITTPLGDVSSVNEVTPLYLEIPVNVVASFEAGPGKVFVGAGPYLSFGIGGKNKLDNTVAGVTTSTSENLKFGTNSDTTPAADRKDLKSTDFGLNFLLGYQLTNGLSINMGYGLGLTNTSADSGVTNSNASAKNSVLSVGLGFAF